MRSIIGRIATGPELSKDISLEEPRFGMSALLNGEVDPIQAAIFLIAPRMKRMGGFISALKIKSLVAKLQVDSQIALVSKSGLCRMADHSCRLIVGPASNN